MTEDLGLKPTKIQQQQLLLSASKKKRWDRGKWMSEEMHPATDKIFVWLEIRFLFTLEGVVNYQNARVYAPSPGNITKGVRIHFEE